LITRVSTVLEPRLYEVGISIVRLRIQFEPQPSQLVANHGADFCRVLADTSGEYKTRLRLLKVAARVVETTSRIRLAFVAACPEADLFRSLPGALLPLGP
jgi:hypothetical protein